MNPHYTSSRSRSRFTQHVLEYFQAAAAAGQPATLPRPGPPNAFHSALAIGITRGLPVFAFLTTSRSSFTSAHSSRAISPSRNPAKNATHTAALSPAGSSLHASKIAARSSREQNTIRASSRSGSRAIPSNGLPPQRSVLAAHRKNRDSISVLCLPLISIMPLQKYCQKALKRA